LYFSRPVYSIFYFRERVREYRRSIIERVWMQQYSNQLCRHSVYAYDIILGPSNMKIPKTAKNTIILPSHSPSLITFAF
jgi:hypothetical protein